MENKSNTLVYCKENELKMFQVVGNSMDNGKRRSFEDGDTVYTKRVETSDFVRAIQGDLGSYWVICTDEGALLRQVISYDDESGIHCKALNTQYDDLFVGLAEVRSMYRVMMLQPKTIYYTRNNNHSCVGDSSTH